MEEPGREGTYKTGTLLVSLSNIWVGKIIVVDAARADIRVVVVEGGRLFVVRTPCVVRVSDLKACGGFLLSIHGGEWCWRDTGVL